jgi:hypothetical protein
MTILKRIKAAVNAWLDRLARQNKAEYGAGALDCCNLEKKKTLQSHNQSARIREERKYNYHA